MDLKFSGQTTIGHDLATNNRTWTTTEEADILRYKANGVTVECHEDYASLHANGACTVEIFAVADNVYVAAAPGELHATESLYYCLWWATEFILTR
jgi:hypothetical protein